MSKISFIKEFKYFLGINLLQNIPFFFLSSSAPFLATVTWLHLGAHTIREVGSPHKGSLHARNLARSIYSISTLNNMYLSTGLPMWLSSKESACQCRRHELDPWVRKSPGEGNGNPLQYSCLGSAMEEEPGGLQSRRWKESDTTDHTCMKKRINSLIWPMWRLKPKEI